ncbi:MAG: DUF4255 domain-containing protein [Planctomycetes bacterium]|nr:DUF4255 domain-containing protein [Planctomycetota bacterium]
MIHEVDAALVALLRSHLAPVLAPDLIAVVSPDEAEAQGKQLGLFPYALVESPSLKNSPRIPISPAQSRRAPLLLDLYYLMTGYPASGDALGGIVESHRMLTRGMRVFHDHGVLSGADFPLDLSPGLAALRWELRVTQHPITIEDLTRVWAAFPHRPLRMSIGFLVTPVPVLSLEFESTPRVLAATSSAHQLVPEGAR